MTDQQQKSASTTAKTEQDPNMAIVEEKIIKVTGDVQIRKYSKGRLLGKGGFAKCYEFQCLENKKIFAAKVVAKSSLVKSRAKQKLISEIKIHKSLHHPQIVAFEHYFEDTENVYILLEMCQNQTLNELLKRRKRLTEIEVQCYMVQLIKALKYLHSHRVIHRDLKLGNLFINEKMEIKIGDFGLARIISPSLKKKITNRVVTLWYRAPELLFGEDHYGPAIDMWSIGCVFCELLTGVLLFKGKREMDQVDKIVEKCGTPNEENWPGVSKLPLYNALCPKNNYPNVLRSIYSDNNKVDDCCFDLLSKMLMLCPKKRITVKEAMEHDFFTKHEPRMCKPSELPKIPIDTHEYQMRKEIKNKNQMNMNVVNNLSGKNNMMIGKKDYKINNNITNNISNNINNNINNVSFSKDNITFGRYEKKVTHDLINNNRFYENKKEFLGKKRDDNKI